MSIHLGPRSHDVPAPVIEPDSTMTYSQFIHGKTIGARRYGLVGITANLQGCESMLETLAQQYRFWGQQPPVANPSAVGVFNYPDPPAQLAKALGSTEPYLLLVQAQQATQANGQPGLDVQGRPFTQHRYIFIPRADIAVLAGRLWLLLNWMVEESPILPVYEQYTPTLTPIQTPGFSAHWYSPVAEQTKLLNALGLHNQFDQPVVTAALGALLQSKRVIFDAADTHNIFSEDLLESILLLLPAAFRSQVSIAAGVLDERICTRARLMVKTNGPPNGSLPEDLVWVKRADNRFFGIPAAQHLASHYTDLLNPILARTDSLKILLKLLDQLSIHNFNDQTEWAQLNNGTMTPHLIPALPDPGERAKYWRSALQKLSPAAWESALPFILDDVGLEIAWEHLQSETKRQPDTFAPLVFQLWQNFSEAYIVYALQEELAQDVALTEALLQHGLLTVLGPQYHTALLECCLQVLQKQATQNHAHALRLADIILNSGRFDRPTEVFVLREATLPTPPQQAALQAFFQESMLPLLPGLSLETLHQSRAYQQLQTLQPQLAELGEKLVQQRGQAIELVPQLAEEASLSPRQRVAFYATCLEAWQPGLHKAHFLVADLLTHWIAAHPAAERPALADYLQPLHGWLGQKIDLTLHPALIDPQGQPTFDTWQQIATTFFDDDHSRVSFLDHATLGHPVTHLAQQWLLLCAEDKAAIDYFQHSYTWHALQNEGLGWMADAIAALLGWTETSLTELLPLIDRVQAALTLPQTTLFQVLDLQPQQGSEELGLMLAAYLPQFAADSNMTPESVPVWQMLQTQAPKVAQLYKVLAEGQRNNAALDLAFDRVHQLKLNSALSEAPEYAIAITHWLKLVGKGSWISGRLLESIVARWRQNPAEIDPALLQLLLGRDLSEKYNVSDWLALAEICWQPPYQTLWPTNGQPDLTSRQRAQVCSLAKQVITTYSITDQTQHLLTAASNWGLTLDDLAEVLSHAPVSACNFSLLRPYLMVNGTVIEVDTPVRQRLVEQALQQTPRDETEETAHQAFLVQLLSRGLQNDEDGLQLIAWERLAIQPQQFRQALKQATTQLSQRNFSTLVYRAQILKRQGQATLSQIIIEALDAYWRQEKRQFESR